MINNIFFPLWYLLSNGINIFYELLNIKFKIGISITEIFVFSRKLQLQNFWDFLDIMYTIILFILGLIYDKTIFFFKIVWNWSIVVLNETNRFAIINGKSFQFIFLKLHNNPNCRILPLHFNGNVITYSKPIIQSSSIQTLLLYHSTHKHHTPKR